MKKRIVPQPQEKQNMETDFQSRVLDWLIKCFGIKISKDILERNDRFIEEALELTQSLNYSAERAHALVDYVYGRDKGEPFQEVGGVMVTLAALCSATGLNMRMDGETEFARIDTPQMIEKIRKKQASKPVGSALPIPIPQKEEAKTVEENHKLTDKVDYSPLLVDQLSNAEVDIINKLADLMPSCYADIALFTIKYSQWKNTALMEENTRLKKALERIATDKTALSNIHMIDIAIEALKSI